MSRRRNKQKSPQNNSKAILRVRTEMMVSGRVEVDPVFEPSAIEKLDQLYSKAGREDYDQTWDNDHKVAYFLYQIFDEILAQYERARSDDDIDPTPGVPNLRESPVREIYDLSNMPRATTILN